MSKICKSCKEEINKKAKKCPYCGSKQGLPGIVKLFIGLVIICIGIVGCVSSCTKSIDDAIDSTDEGNNNLELIESKKTNDSVFAYIEGKVKNNTDKEYSYVQVIFNTYDKDGNTTGTCIDNNSGLNPNGTWKFKAICDAKSSDIAKFDLKDITGTK